MFEELSADPDDVGGWDFEFRFSDFKFAQGVWGLGCGVWGAVWTDSFLTTYWSDST